MFSLLLIEDNKLLSLMEQRHLGTAFPEVALSTACNREEAIRKASVTPPNVVVMDCQLPWEAGGGEFLDELLSIASGAKVIITSAEPPEVDRGSKVFEVLDKPFETEELVFIVGRALRTCAAEILEEGKGDRVAFDRHKVLNVLAGILAGIRAFEADLDAEADNPAVVREMVSEYVPRLVDMLNQATTLIRGPR